MFQFLPSGLYHRSAKYFRFLSSTMSTRLTRNHKGKYGMPQSTDALDSLQRLHEKVRASQTSVCRPSRSKSHFPHRTEDYKAYVNDKKKSAT